MSATIWSPSTPRLPEPLEALFSAWERARDELAPLAPLTRQLLETWRAADRAWSSEASAPDARRDALVTQWGCRALFEVVGQYARAVPWRSAIDAGLVAFDDALDTAAAFGDGPAERVGQPGGLTAVWSALLAAAGRDAGALDRALATMDASCHRAALGSVVELDAIAALVAGARIDAAIDRLARVTWPSDRARAVQIVAPRIADDPARRARVLDAAWVAVRDAARPELHYRVSHLASLVALDGAPGPHRAARARELADLAATLPAAELGPCQDHDDLRVAVASALAGASCVDEAVAWARKVPREYPWALADAAAALPEPHRTALGLEQLAHHSAGHDHGHGHDHDEDDAVACMLAAISPAVAAACAEWRDRVSATSWDAALRRVELAVHLPARAGDALEALEAQLATRADALRHVDAALDALGALRALEPARVERITTALVAAVVARAEPDPNELAEVVALATDAQLGDALGAIERASTAVTSGAEHAERRTLRAALAALRVRLAGAVAPDPAALEARAAALAERLAVPDDVLHDPDDPALAALPVSVRRDVVARAMREAGRRAWLPLELTVHLDALDPDGSDAPAPGASAALLAAAARALARDASARADVDAALAAPGAVRTALVAASMARSWTALLEGLARGAETHLPRRLPEGWRVWFTSLREDSALARWRARQTDDALRAPSPVATVEADAPTPGPNGETTLAELVALDATLGVGDDPAARGSRLDGELWQLARAFWTRGQFDRARATLPRFGWSHYRNLCAVELECAAGDRAAAERAMSVVLEPPDFYTTPHTVAGYAARVPGALYAVAARAQSPGMREALVAMLLEAAREPAAWTRDGLDRDRVRDELATAIDAAIARGDEVPAHAVPLAFRVLPRATQRRAWAWAFGAEARAVARLDSFPRVDVLGCACDVAGAEVAPQLAAIEARLGARVSFGVPAPSVAVV